MTDSTMTKLAGHVRTPDEAILVRLAHTANDLWSADRPKDRTVAGARLLGHADIVCAIGWTMTPAAVEIAAADMIRKLGTLPPSTSDNAARKVWFAEAVAFLADAFGLSDYDPDPDASRRRPRRN